MAPPDYARRLAETRTLLREHELDALLAASEHNRRYLTGFTPTDGDITESSGDALVTPDKHFLITATFFIQGLEHEVEPSGAGVILADKTTPAAAVAALIRGNGIRRLGFEKEWMSFARYQGLREALEATEGDPVELIPVSDLVMSVRQRKDEAEVTAIRRAAAIADQAFDRLASEIRAGMTERQIALRLENLMRAQGADGPSFPTIVACGPSSALPHAVPTDREIQPGEPLLIDFGCRADGYCSDLTRTICLGEPSPRLVEIYHVVRAAQDAAEEALRRGERRGRDVDGAARAVIAGAGHGDAFFHALGHGVGLAVHELPVLASPRGDDPQREAALAQIEGIATESVVTVEPGIYLAGWGGVRLEDMALVREDGVELLASRNPPDILRVGQ